MLSSRPFFIVIGSDEAVPFTIGGDVDVPLTIGPVVVVPFTIGAMINILINVFKNLSRSFNSMNWY